MSEFIFEITQSTINNKRIYFSAEFRSFFPEDAFGTRKEGDVGTSVSFEADGVIIETDIRVNSSLVISPRKSFRSFIESNNFTPGSKVIVKKISERYFLLKPI